jgi:hypothetical protein
VCPLTGECSRLCILTIYLEVQQWTTGIPSILSYHCRCRRPECAHLAAASLQPSAFDAAHRSISWMTSGLSDTNKPFIPQRRVPHSVSSIFDLSRESTTRTLARFNGSCLPLSIYSRNAKSYKKLRMPLNPKKTTYFALRSNKLPTYEKYLLHLRLRSANITLYDLIPP